MTELFKIFPIGKIVYEYVKADVDLTSGRKTAKKGKGFSPVGVFFDEREQLAKYTA